MKLKTTILALFVSAFTQIHAQVQFKPGLRAGANFSDLTNSDLKTKAGYYVGFTGGLQLSKYYALQPEFGFTQQGAQGYYNYPDDQSSGVIRSYEHINLNYVSFGLINKFTFGEIMNFHVGPNMDFEIDQHKFSNVPVDLAMNVGVGFDFPSGFGLEFRAKKGLFDVLDSSGYRDGNYLFSKWRYNTNILFQAGLSYTFKIKH
jgi:hypothetical protein